MTELPANRNVARSPPETVFIRAVRVVSTGQMLVEAEAKTNSLS